MQSVQLLKLCKQFVLYLCQAMLFSFHTASHDCKPTPAYILQRGRNSRCLVHSLSVTLLNQRFTQRLVWNPAVIAIPLFLLRVGTLHLFRMQGWLHEAPYSWLLIIPCCSSSRTWALRLALASFTKPSFWTSHSETFPKLRVPLDSFSSQHGWFLSSGINISPLSLSFLRSYSRQSATTSLWQMVDLCVINTAHSLGFCCCAQGNLQREEFAWFH